MEFGFALSTVVLLALLLATVAGFLAARVLMHAAETPKAGGPDGR